MELILETKELIRLTGVNSGIAGKLTARNSFAEFLEKRGLLATPGETDFQRVVCIDYSSKYKYQASHPRLGPENRTLVRMEPSVVLPANFSSLRRQQFGLEVTVGGKPNGNSASVHWPLVFPSETELAALHSAERSELAVLINGNKMSFVKGELYSLRRKAIRTFHNLDVFGNEWGSKLMQRLFIAIRSFAHSFLSLRVPQVQGVSMWFQSYPKSILPVDDKLAAMSKYKYALVIENSAEYMSEKLMEALFAGCIPIYVGPDPQEYGIPIDLVIWTKPNIRSIENSFKEAATWKFDEFHARLAMFLRSGVTRELWDHERVHERLLDLIQGTK
jgi:hypothetical protein